MSRLNDARQLMVVALVACGCARSDLRTDRGGESPCGADCRTEGDDGGGGADAIALSTELEISDGDPYDFGMASVGGGVEHTFTITNIGEASATALTLTIGPTPFTGGLTTCAASLSQGSTCLVVVRFTAAAEGVASGNLTVAYHDGHAPVDVARQLRGEGRAVWTWIAGSSTRDARPHFDTVADPANTPGGRDNGASWTTDDSLILFGGYGCDDGGAPGRLSDLWQVEFASLAWRWIGGPSSIEQAGVYGTRGVPAPANNPGARNDSAAWRDPATGELGELRRDRVLIDDPMPQR